MFATAQQALLAVMISAGAVLELTGALQAAQCRKDCFGSPQQCPAGYTLPDFDSAAALGLPARPCSGRGVCISGSGVCSCHVGYSGAACHVCATGFMQVGVEVAVLCVVAHRARQATQSTFVMVCMKGSPGVTARC